MKKWIVLLLAVSMCLTLVACGSGNKVPTNAETPSDKAITPEKSEPEEIKLALGETAKTDIVEFTLDAAKLTEALTNSASTNNADSYGFPKEYSANEDASNPFVASVGHVLVFASFTIHNTNRTSLDLGGSFNGSFTKVEYQGNSFSNQMRFTAEFSGDSTHWNTYSSSNILLSPDETSSYRGYIDIAANPDSLDDSFVLSFILPTSSGEQKTFSYEINAADVSAAMAKEQAKQDEIAAAAEAAIQERKTETDAETVTTVKSLLQGEWEYTDYSSGNAVKQNIVFDGSKVVVTSTALGLTLEKVGTYTVCIKDIFIDFEDEDYIDCFIPYELENGELTIYHIENIVK